MLRKLFEKEINDQWISQKEVSAAGSNRGYYRIIAEKNNYIGVIGTDKAENRAFVAIAEHFLLNNIPVPNLIAVATDYSCYILQDLGDELLFDFIENGRTKGNFDANETKMLHSVIRWLPKIQFEGIANFDFSVCYPQADFNRRTVFWDLNYFKYSFLKTTGVEFQEDKLETDFERFATILLANMHEAFMYRDFQSRNVMIHNGTPYFIDFQGGRKGPYLYDVASFLWQAKARYSDELKADLLTTYWEELKKYVQISQDEFQQKLQYFVFFRTLQVLGAYGFRGYFEQKSHFIQSIPYAIENLKKVLESQNIKEEFPYLSAVLTKMCILPQFALPIPKQVLEVEVMSFSYRKGIPLDASGNGGGFVFDCRSIHNPGRYKTMATLTGLDTPVIEFLEREGEITTFLNSARQLVDTSVTRYLERGFTNLMVCFGCTGGQHRSVYSAEDMAKYINEKYNVKVHLTHREQKIERVLEYKADR